MHRFSLRCFGVGDGWPCADRNHSAFLYRFGHATFLVDCGEPISGLYRRSGLSYDLIDRIFISHLHCDHIGGFFMLMQGLWLEQRQKDLPVHMPQDGIEPVRKMLDAACIFDELYAFRLRFEPLQAGEPIVHQQVRITPFKSTHLESLRHAFQSRYTQHFAAFCFLMESDRLRIGHSADIGRPEDLEPMFTAPLDLLVCELSHFRPEDLFRYLATKPVKRVVFMHIGRRYYANIEETRLLAAQHLKAMTFSFAHDDDEITL